MGVGGQLGPPEPTFGNRLLYIAATRGVDGLEALVFTGSKVEDPTLPRVIDHDEAGEFSIPQMRDETWRERAERLEQEVGRLRKFAAIVSDLDRCEHGRHEGDVCGSCGGPSRGNPLMIRTDCDHVRFDNLRNPPMTFIPARTVGFTMGAAPIVDPGRSLRHDPDAWVQK